MKTAQFIPALMLGSAMLAGLALNIWGGAGWPLVAVLLLPVLVPVLGLAAYVIPVGWMGARAAWWHLRLGDALRAQKWPDALVFWGRPGPYGAEYLVKTSDGLSDWNEESALARLGKSLGAWQVRIRAVERRGNLYRVQVLDRDPLAGAWSLDAPLIAPASLESLPIGRAENGDLVSLPIANTSGLLIGGMPGSAKTGSVSTWLGSWVSQSAVQFALFDGKGGADWAWIEPRCFLWNNDDADLTKVADQLDGLVELMRQRVRDAAHLRDANAWSEGMSETWPLIVIVLDECQTYFDTTGADKAKKDEIGRCTRAITELVKKGRSAGMYTILTTQKPTADSIPTAIRDNAGGRACFAVESADAAVATLGTEIRESDVKPTSLSLPTDRGVCVVKVEGVSGFSRVRAPFVGRAELASWAETHAFRVLDPRRPDPVPQATNGAAS